MIYDLSGHNTRFYGGAQLGNQLVTFEGRNKSQVTENLYRLLYQLIRGGHCQFPTGRPPSQAPKGSKNWWKRMPGKKISKLNRQDWSGEVPRVPQLPAQKLRPVRDLFEVQQHSGSQPLQDTGCCYHPGLHPGLSGKETVPPIPGSHQDSSDHLQSQAGAEETEREKSKLFCLFFYCVYCVLQHTFSQAKLLLFCQR